MTLPWLKRLVWLYIFFLIFEGALRKWYLPSLSVPLLVVRDPIVILLYLGAFQLNLFPKNTLTRVALIFGVIATVITVALSMRASGYVALYGFRANFMHIPLIFLLPQILDWNDFLKIGKVFLYLAIPMAFLMAFQYRADGSEWINKGIGEGQLLSSAFGRIRPSGTFSFSTGPVAFYSIVLAYILGGYTHRLYPQWLLLLAGSSTLLAASVSGSRALLGSLCVVLVAYIYAGIIQPKYSSRGLQGLFFLALAGMLLMFNNDDFQSGLETMQERITLASAGEGGMGGFFSRIYTDWLAPFYWFSHAPLFGYGLGLGTNAGSKLVSGEVNFLLAESEWSRMMLELGPMLGFAYVILRISLVWQLLQKARLALRYQNVMGIVLFGACALNVLSGQWGPPTGLGFATFAGGLVLIACKYNFKNG